MVRPPKLLVRVKICNHSKKQNINLIRSGKKSDENLRVVLRLFIQYPTFSQSSTGRRRIIFINPITTSRFTDDKCNRRIISSHVSDLINLTTSVVIFFWHPSQSKHWIKSKKDNLMSMKSSSLHRHFYLIDIFNNTKRTVYVSDEHDTRNNS